MGGATAATTTISNTLNGVIFNKGVTTISWKITDVAGNFTSCNFNVTVNDIIKPTITCAGTQTATASSSCTATVNLNTPVTSDNCGVASVTNDHPGTTFPIGTSTVTWTVTDINGNTNSCQQLVIVSDRTTPSITCESNISVSPNTPGCKAIVSLSTPVVSDCNGPVTTTYNISGAGASGPSSGSGAVGTRTFNTGITNITYTATDGAGNTNSCSMSITVTNNLTASISGTATATQNTSTTSDIVFTFNGGLPQYLFTYGLSVDGGAANTYSSTANSSPSTVIQSNAAQGVYVYTLLSVTDQNGCAGVITSQNTATVTVVNGPEDFTPTVDIAGLSFATEGSNRDFLININEISQLASSFGQLQFRIVKLSAFTITYSTVNGISNVFGSTPNNNGDWTFSENTFFITVTLKPGLQINSNSFNRIGINIACNTGVAANTSQSLTVTIVNGSGGDNNPNNNTSNTVVTAQ